MHMQFFYFRHAKWEQNKTIQQTLKDFKIQGFSLDLKYLGPSANTKYHRSSLEVDIFAMWLLILKPEKTPWKLLQLSISLVFNLSLPHFSALFILSYLVFLAIKIFSQGQTKRTFQQIFLCILMRWALHQPASLRFQTHQPFRASRIVLPDSFCGLQMLLFCVSQRKYNLLPSSQLPHAQLHALSSWSWQTGLPAAQGYLLRVHSTMYKGNASKLKKLIQNRMVHSKKGLFSTHKHVSHNFLKYWLHLAVTPTCN